MPSNRPSGEAIVRLTDLVIKGLPAPEAGQKVYRDDLISGFAVRVSPGGTKTFLLIHGKERRFTTIGRVGVVKLADARQKARDILAAKQLGLTHDCPASAPVRQIGRVEEGRISGPS